jgi:5-methylthioadenosine/S-adenosylhomocysteine deaminase
MDKSRRVIENGCVVIDGNKIVAVDKTQNIEKKQYKPDRIIDAKRHAILPGLISTHTHIPQILLRCMGDDVDLITWMENKILSPHAHHYKPKDMYFAAATGFIEAVKSGTTTSTDAEYIGPEIQLIDEVFKGAKDVGNRAIIDKKYETFERFNDVHIPIPERFASTFVSLDEHIKQFKTLHKRWHKKCDGRLYSWGGPDWPLTCYKESLRIYTDIVLELDTKFSFHLAESKEDAEMFQKHIGKSQTEWLYEACPRMGEVLVAVHAVWLSDRDIDILAQTNTPVSHNITSNCYIADGFARVPEMLDKGVTISLGVDGAASNTTQNLWEELKWTALIHKSNYLDPAIIRAEDVLEMATINGAKALGLEHEIGSIETGKKADLILVNLTDINYTPLNRIISQLVYSGAAQNVDTAIINGEVVMEHRKMTLIDEEEIKKQTQKAADQLLERAGTLQERKRPWRQ